MRASVTPDKVKDPLFSTLSHILRHWWLMLVTGLLLTGAGVWVLYYPFWSFLALSRFFSAGMVGAGLLDILFALNNRRSKRWMWWLPAGIADIVIGVYLFNDALIAIVLLPLIIGLWTFYKGFMAIGDAWHIQFYGAGNWRRLLFTAVLVLLMGLLLMVCPLIGIENIFLFSGLALIAAGLFRIHLSLKLLAIERKIKI